MSIEQFRAQRDYQEAADLEREATQRIAELETELAKWRGVQEHARQVGAKALAAMQGQTETAPPASDISSDQ